MAWKDTRESLLLPPITMERLRAWRARLMETADRARMKPWWKGYDGPTMAELIARLLDFQASKRSRVKRSKRRRQVRAMLALMDWQPVPTA